MLFVAIVNVKFATESRGSNKYDRITKKKIDINNRGIVNI